MSYEADCSGTIALRKMRKEEMAKLVRLLVKTYGKEAESIEGFFEDFWGPIPEITVVKEKRGNISLDCSGSGNYHGEDVEFFLKLFAPYVSYGRVQFEDGGSTWRFVFDEKEHAWLCYDMVMMLSKGEAKVV